MSALTDALRAALEEAEAFEAANEQLVADNAAKAAQISELEAEIQHPTGAEVTVVLNELSDLAQVYMDTPNGQDAEEQQALASFLAAHP